MRLPVQQQDVLRATLVASQALTKTTSRADSRKGEGPLGERGAAGTRLGEQRVGDRNWEERRESDRLAASEFPHVTARLEGSREVRLLDISRRGVQFETPVRLRPGTEVALRFIARGEHVTLTGRVVRSLVSALNGSQLIYRTALNFPGDIAFYGRLAGPEEASAAVPVPTTGAPAAPAPAVFDVTSSAMDAKLQELLSANDW